MVTTTGTWRDATNLVALDLEGSGAQDRDEEAILEIAAVRLIGGLPDITTAYTTLINPGRPMGHRPWISPGLTTAALAGAPTLDAVEPDLAVRLHHVYLVGHNISVDWRLLRRRCPSIIVAGLIDTYQLAKTVHAAGKRNLTALLDEHHLTDQVTATAPTSRPHRALWDTIGAAMLLNTLVRLRWDTDPSLEDLLRAAKPPPGKASNTPPSLFDTADE